MSAEGTVYSILIYNGSLNERRRRCIFNLIYNGSLNERRRRYIFNLIYNGSLNERRRCCIFNLILFNHALLHVVLIY